MDRMRVASTRLEERALEDEFAHLAREIASWASLFVALAAVSGRPEKVKK